MCVSYYIAFKYALRLYITSLQIAKKRSDLELIKFGKIKPYASCIILKNVEQFFRRCLLL